MLFYLGEKPVREEFVSSKIQFGRYFTHLRGPGGSDMHISEDLALSEGAGGWGWKVGLIWSLFDSKSALLPKREANFRGAGASQDAQVCIFAKI